MSRGREFQRSGTELLKALDPMVFMPVGGIVRLILSCTSMYRHIDLIYDYNDYMIAQGNCPDVKVIRHKMVVGYCKKQVVIMLKSL